MRQDSRHHEELFKKWQSKLQIQLDTFLHEIKSSLGDFLENKKGTVLISYVPDSLISDNKRHTIDVSSFAQELSNVLQSMGLSAQSHVLDAAQSLGNLNAFDVIIVLCTPAYAEIVKANSSLRVELDKVGRRHKQALQPILCVGGFQDTALAIVDSHYLIRDFTAIFKGHDYRLEWVTRQLEDSEIQRGLFYVESRINGLSYALFDNNSELRRGTVSAAALKQMRLPAKFHNRAQLESYWISIFDHLVKQGSIDFDQSFSESAKMDLLFSPNSAQGIGLLPDILRLKDKEHAVLEENYNEAFSRFESSLTISTAQLTLNKALDNSICQAPDQYKAIDDIKVSRDAQQYDLASSFKSFLDAGCKAKIQLLLCETSDQINVIDQLTARYLATQEYLVLQIECARFAGKANEALTETLTNLKIPEKVLHQLPIVIFLKGYQELQDHINLYELNQLSRWPHLKVIVSCESGFFAKHSLLNCFLKRGSERKTQHLQVCTVSPLKLTRLLSTSRSNKSFAPKISKPRELYKPSIRWSAHQQEILTICRHLNQMAVELGLLKANSAQNPQVFISYAWEPAGLSREQQHFYLRSVAANLRQLGLRPWLDVEQMSGDIDAQMAGNIQESSIVLVIGSPLYAKRSSMETNVRKEYLEIMRQQQGRELKVIGLHYLGDSVNTAFPTFTLPIPIVDVRDACAVNIANPDVDGKLHFYSHCQRQKLLYQIISTICKADQLPAIESEFMALECGFSSILDSVSEKYLISAYNDQLIKNLEVTERLENYIDPYALISETAPISDRFALKPHIETFLSGQNHTFVTLARAGSGKSMFALDILNRWACAWQVYRTALNETIPEWIPIYISLKDYTQETTTIINTALHRQYGLTSAEIEVLRTKPLLFICDGFDELGGSAYPNLSMQISSFVCAKLLVTSRPEAFDDSQPFSDVFKTDNGLLQSIVLSSFIPSEIERYIRHYEKDDDSLENTTFKILNDLPGLMALIENPFLLSMVLHCLPEFLRQRSLDIDENIPIIRGDIYEAFLLTWFKEETQGRERYLQAARCREFAEQLAYMLFTNNTLAISSKQSEIWQFFNEAKHQILQETLPLRLNQGEFNFLHKSLYEYLAANYLYNKLAQKSPVNAWNTRRAHEEPGILSFLSERYSQDRINGQEPFKPLMSLIEGSRLRDWSIAASSAITVLNHAHVAMSGLDLSRINIDGADLSGGIFDGANFELANLQNVSFERAWLSRASFKAANMQQVDFSEWPFLNDPANSTVCAYSHDNLFLAVGYRNGLIIIYNATSFEKIREHNAHKGEITALVYRPDSLELASASNDGMIHIWDSSGDRLTPLRSHGDYPPKTFDDFEQMAIVTVHPLTLAYRPDGIELASGYNVAEIKIWCAQGLVLEPLKTISIADAKKILSICYRPDNKELAVSTKNGSVILFDTSNGFYNIKKMKHSISGEMTYSNCLPLIYSNDSKYLITRRDTVCIDIWDAKSENFVMVKSIPYNGRISVFAYHPYLSHLITGDITGTITFWDVSRDVGQALSSFISYKGLSSISYRTDGVEFAVSTANGVKSFKSKFSYQNTSSANHITTSYISSVCFTPNGKELVTGSMDLTVDFWPVKCDRQSPLRSLMYTDDKSGDQFPSSISFHPDGFEFYIGNGGRWKIENNLITKLNKLTCADLRSMTDASEATAYSTDGLFFAEIITNIISDKIAIWRTHDVPDAKPFRVLDGAGVGQSLGYQPRHHALACASKDALKVWDSNGNLFLNFGVKRGFVPYFCFRSDGSELIWPSCNKGFYVLIMGGDEPLLHLVNSGSCQTNRLIYNHDGGQVGAIVGGVNIYVYDTAAWLNAQPGSPDNPNKIDTPERFVVSTSDNISCLAVSPGESNQLATGHEDGSIRIWKWVNTAITLLWQSKTSALFVSGLEISNAFNLNPRYKMLLKAKGAVDTESKKGLSATRSPLFFGANPKKMNRQTEKPASPDTSRLTLSTKIQRGSPNQKAKDSQETYSIKP